MGKSEQIDIELLSSVFKVELSTGRRIHPYTNTVLDAQVVANGSLAFTDSEDALGFRWRIVSYPVAVHQEGAVEARLLC